MKKLKLVIVPSTTNPGELSVRLVGDEAVSARRFKKRLVQARFRAGDRVVLIAKEDYDRMTAQAGEVKA